MDQMTDAGDVTRNYRQSCCRGRKKIEEREKFRNSEIFFLPLLRPNRGRRPRTLLARGGPPISMYYRGARAEYGQSSDTQPGPESGRGARSSLPGRFDHSKIGGWRKSTSDGEREERELAEGERASRSPFITTRRNHPRKCCMRSRAELRY